MRCIGRVQMFLSTTNSATKGCVFSWSPFFGIGQTCCPPPPPKFHSSVNWTEEHTFFLEHLVLASLRIGPLQGDQYSTSTSTRVTNTLKKSRIRETPNRSTNAMGDGFATLGPPLLHWENRMGRGQQQHTDIATTSVA